MEKSTYAFRGQIIEELFGQAGPRVGSFDGGEMKTLAAMRHHSAAGPLP